MSTAVLRHDLSDLRYLMRRLRDPDTGCPWDLHQTFATLAPFALEEACEVIDTIERNDHAHLCEELGDLLLQVIFHSQLAEEQVLFSFDDVVHQIVAKLITRHPHVFPDGTLHSKHEPGAMERSEADVRQTWELLKDRARIASGHRDRFADIPLALPALCRAEKLQKRAAKRGFDWRSVQGVIAKMDEEFAELNEAIASGDRNAMEEEMGDMLFCCVNLSRHLQIDAEGALRRANNKFERRFRTMELIAADQGRDFGALDSAEHEELWAWVKAQELSIE